MAFKFEIPESVQKELAERDEKQAKEVESKADIICFPNCPPEKQAAPSSLLRSALFGVVRRGKRAYKKDVELTTWGNVTVKYTGEQLMQSDQDVWLACVQAFTQQKKINIVIPQRELIKLSGRKGVNAERLWADLKRLTYAGIEVIDGRYAYTGTLLNKAVKDKETGHILISVNSEMFDLFGGNVTHIETEKRHALKMDLAKWLQGYVCSHKSTWKKPHWVSLDKLKELSGVEISAVRDFRVKIKKAMDELKELDVVAGWKLEDDMLTLWRPSK